MLRQAKRQARRPAPRVKAAPAPKVETRREPRLLRPEVEKAYRKLEDEGRVTPRLRAAARYLSWKAVMAGDPERSRILAIINHGAAGPVFFSRTDIPYVSAWLTRRTKDAPECVQEMVRGALAVATFGSRKGRIGSEEEQGELLASVCRFVADQLVRVAAQQ
jgi:hypothetical protein